MPKSAGNRLATQQSQKSGKQVSGNKQPKISGKIKK